MNRLFTEQELDNIDGNLFAEREQSGPVTCLGMEFENDEARREYFRAELRKKLPELRHIEGFPIGEDDDIIALSDPPYYTACPNPWLNDFIAQWEAEKADLEARGLRTSDFEVKEPYAADVQGIKNDSVYRSLFYHTKVPQAIIKKYLSHYTTNGDIVLDSFAGSGMTGLSCQTMPYGHNSTSNHRHCICGDLSPFAMSMAYNLNTPINTPAVKFELDRIVKEIEHELGWMFQTKHVDNTTGTINCVVYSDIVICNHCSQEFVLWDEAVDKSNKLLRESVSCPHCGNIETTSKLNKATQTIFDDALQASIRQRKSVPVLIVYTVGKKRYEKRPDDFDKAILDKINSMEIPYWYPSNPMMGIGNEWGDTWRAGVHIGISHVHHFYTKRNLIALASFYDKILKSAYKNKLLYLFTGMIVRSTIMNRVHFTKYLNGKTDWDAGHLKGTMYVPSYSVESSVIAQIHNKWGRYEKAAPLLPQQYDNALTISSSSKLLLEDSCVDYIFVDPPFGANIIYSELNYLAEAWLKVITNNEEEAIEDSTHNKTLEFYHNAMVKCFQELYRVLKAGHWMTVEFSNTSAAVWNAIQQAIIKAGFVIANVSALNKGQGGMRSITTTTAVNQDLAISCYKPTDELTQKFQNSSDTAANVWDFVSELLEHLPVHVIKQQKTTTIVERSPKILFDRLIAYYVQHGYPVPLNAQDFQKGLRDRFIELDGMFFTAPQAAEYQEKKRDAPEMLPMGLIVSDEANAIEWLKIKLRERPMTYQEIQPDFLKDSQGQRKGDKIPGLDQLLEENFIDFKVKEGANEKTYWRLPNIQDDKDVAALRTKALMREFKLYVEQASKPKGKIKEARVEALRAGFKQCYIDKDFKTIVMVGDRIPANLRDEDEVLLQFYDIALNKI